jgi:predicted lysophospholipase L1 biosynthesis ABC-type transport system permease subunit
VILSEAAARFFCPHDAAVGRTIAWLHPMLGLSAAPEVIGVVADAKYDGLDAPLSTTLYVPWARRPMGSGYLMARTSLDPSALTTAVRRAAAALDATVPLPEVQPVNDIIAQSIAVRRVRALPAVGFGALAIAVAFVGIVATVSTLVAERWRDLAIRAALGASPARLTWTIVRHGLALVAAGLAIGLGLGSAAARGLSPLLYGISPFDPMTFLGTIILVGGGATLLTYAAGRRAGLVLPMKFLRHD